MLVVNAVQLQLSW